MKEDEDYSESTFDTDKSESSIGKKKKKLWNIIQVVSMFISVNVILIFFSGNSCASLSACLCSDDALSQARGKSQRILSDYVTLTSNGSIESNFFSDCEKKEDSLDNLPEKRGICKSETIAGFSEISCEETSNLLRTPNYGSLENRKLCRKCGHYTQQ